MAVKRKAWCKYSKFYIASVLVLSVVLSLYLPPQGGLTPYKNIFAGLNQEEDSENASLQVLKINHNFNNTNLEPGVNVSTGANEAGEMNISSIGLPLKKVPADSEEQIKVIPCGITVGVKIDTDGIMVLGTGYINSDDGTAHKPAEGKLNPGDLILSVNGTEVRTKEELRDEVNKSPEGTSLKIKRDEELIEVYIVPIKSTEDSINKIGVWVRDSTQGIGTITYINPETMKFGALGHGILDVDTKKLMTIKAGEVTSADVHSIKKGRKGSPGELIGDIKLGCYFGKVSINNQYGIYGTVEGATDWMNKEPIPIAVQSQVVPGAAVILSSIGGTDVKEYEAVIETVNKYSTDDSKGMVIRIVDEDLLELTNGIVQGMSGSPIIQDGRIVGAVTHVFVQDPTKGYGIFIENMLKQEKGF